MAEKTQEELKVLTLKEIESLIVSLGKQGLTSEKIGLALKKEHNIKAKKQGIKIGKIMKDNQLENTPDIKNIQARIQKLEKHLGKNKHDNATKRTLLIKRAKLRKLVK